MESLTSGAQAPLFVIRHERSGATGPVPGSRAQAAPSPHPPASAPRRGVRPARVPGEPAVVVLGALGGDRLDHEAANLLLLADPGYDGVRIEARRGALRIRAVRGKASLALTAPVGALVTLLPVNGDADGVTTEGLRYPLRGETLRFGRARGLSNEVTSLPAKVSVDKGTLLV